MIRPHPRRLLHLLLILPALFISCGSVFQGPVVGSIRLDHPGEAGDAVVFLRCRGGGLHGEITTDAEQTRVGTDGHFAFIGSLTFPTTEYCHVSVRHPRYQTVRVDLADELIQTLEPIALTSMGQLFKAGPGVETDSRYPWPQSEVYRHLSDTLFWLRSFPVGEQHNMARYVPVIHDIYRQAYQLLSPGNSGLRDMLRLTGMIEEQTAYACGVRIAILTENPYMPYSPHEISSLLPLSFFGMFCQIAPPRRYQVNCC
jgi:hypothetical protein